MPMEYTITPLIVARGIHREMSRFTYLNNFGQKIEFLTSLSCCSPPS